MQKEERGVESSASCRLLIRKEKKETHMFTYVRGELLKAVRRCIDVQSLVHTRCVQAPNTKVKLRETIWGQEEVQLSWHGPTTLFFFF